MASPRAVPVRGTQTLVDQMGWVFRRPTITALESSVALAVWRAVSAGLLAQRKAYSFGASALKATGLANIDTQNPWIAATQLGEAWTRYEPLVARELRWTRAGRGAGVDRDIESGAKPCFETHRAAHAHFGRGPCWYCRLRGSRRLGAWLWCWFRSVSWVAATHISVEGEPDLIGYSMWVIFLSLGFFTVWALVSWAISVAPLRHAA